MDGAVVMPDKPLEALTVLYGAGGHAKVVLEALLASDPTLNAVILDENSARHGTQFLGFPVLGGRDWLTPERALASTVIPAIGDNVARQSALEWIRSVGARCGTVIHPSCQVSPSVRIAEGVFLAAGTIVNAQATIGAGAILNTACSVDHDCVVGAAVHLGPGVRLCGGVTIGARTLVGVGSVVIPQITIGEGAVIGAGSVIVRNIPDGVRVAGNPARPIRL
jgi:sugar O-acyltransferase (sialic acid O-acetyltransferase NeuD family)